MTGTRNNDRAERRDVPRPARERHDGPGERVRAWMRGLGPGLVTGAADDDPSGIATYSQAGAAFGYGLLWTSLVSLPLMAAVQVMCARIGIITNGGLARALRQHYPRPVLWSACVLLVIANTLNIAADLRGMAAATALIVGGSAHWLVPVYTALILALVIFASYVTMTRVLKWLALSLFAYVAAGFLSRPHWGEVLLSTVTPRPQWGHDYLLMLVAIFGTTISPYLFFWQSAHNAEDEAHRESALGDRPRRAIQRELRGARADVLSGMTLSNLIMYFIILTAGATLHRAGLTNIDTAEQAAQALKPLAGEAASLLFTLGIVATGMLAVPVLAGSGAYAVSEAAAWRRGMDEPVRNAWHFYGVLAAAMLIGMVLGFTPVSPIRMLVWSAVVNGLLAPPLIVLILLVCNNPAAVGEQRNTRTLNVLGGIAALVMTVAAVALIWTSL